MSGTPSEQPPWLTQTHPPEPHGPHSTHTLVLNTHTQTHTTFHSHTVAHFRPDLSASTHARRSSEPVLCLPARRYSPPYPDGIRRYPIRRSPCALRGAHGSSIVTSISRNPCTAPCALVLADAQSAIVLAPDPDALVPGETQCLESFSNLKRSD